MVLYIAAWSHHSSSVPIACISIDSLTYMYDEDFKAHSSSNSTYFGIAKILYLWLYSNEKWLDSMSYNTMHRNMTMCRCAKLLLICKYYKCVLSLQNCSKPLMASTLFLIPGWWLDDIYSDSRLQVGRFSNGKCQNCRLNLKVFSIP